MTPEQVKLVRLSFVRIMDLKMEIGRLFYDRLFTIAPDVRPMFKQDIDAQARKLMDMLAFAVGSLRQPVMLSGMLGSLAKRHVTYGVRDEHYPKVGEALIWSLEKNLGADFTKEVKEAWTALYGDVVSVMRAATSDAHRASA